MEFHVLRLDLLAELQLMMGVIEKKNTMPILANIYIKAENNQLSLQATDLEVGIISTCPAQVVDGGEFTVNAKRLQEMLNTFSGQQVSFNLSEGSMLDLVSEEAQFSIETMPTHDFPTIPEYDFSDAIQLDRDLFLKCMNRVIFSISADPHKFALNGSLFRIQEGQLYLISTDGHRMSFVQQMVNIDRNIEQIIPRKTMLELKKSIQAESDEDILHVGFKESRVFFKIGVRTLFSRLIDGKFPDFEKAIPSNNDKVFVFPRPAILEILRRKSVFSSERSKLVRFSFSNGQLVVVLRNPERGESVDRMDIEYEGEPLDVGFNVDYVQEFFKSMDAEKIEIHLKDETNQGLFKVFGEDDIEYKHVIMPMRLTS